MASLRPPVRMPLARPAREVPASRPGRELRYEPKFDGWRGLLFADAGQLQSRQGNSLTGRFPEIVRAGTGLGDVVLDGEIVALREGRLDIGALASSPQARLRSGAVVYYAVFDLLAADDADWRPRPYRERRARLETLLAGVAPPLQLVPSTSGRDAALAWMRPEVAEVGIEGVIAKRADSAYRAGRTDAWVKVRQTIVVDAVVIGVTGDPREPRELVLARRDESGAWRQIGLSLPLAPPLRRQVGSRVTTTGAPAVYASAGGFGRGRTEYRPVRPDVVVEVEAEPTVESFRSRQRPRVHRLRLDLDAGDVGR